MKQTIKTLFGYYVKDKLRKIGDCQDTTKSSRPARGKILKGHHCFE